MPYGKVLEVYGYMGATLHLVQPEHPSKTSTNSLAGSKRQTNISSSAGAAGVVECLITSILPLPSPWEGSKGSVPVAICKCAAGTSFHSLFHGNTRMVTPSPALMGVNLAQR